MARPFGGVNTPPYRTNGKGSVGGDACIAPQSLPCVKGGAPQGRRDCDLARVVRCMGKVTIPHRLSAEPPLHKGAFNSTLIEFLLAPEGSMWEEYKAPLRKCSHSCIFRRFVL